MIALSETQLGLLRSFDEQTERWRSAPLDAASGTLSSLRKLGLVERSVVRNARGSQTTLYVITPRGRAVLHPKPGVEYARVKHATHGGVLLGRGWDLEQWSFVAPTTERPEGVPADAAYHSGSVDAQGRQVWLYVRAAPMTPGPCGSPECPFGVDEGGES